MTDVVAQLSGPLVHGSDSPAPVVLTAGGSAANTAAWLAATGTPTVLVGRVGVDLAGDAAVSALERVGVMVRLARDPHRATGTCIVLVSPEGERTMIPDAGANAGLARSDLPAELLDGSTHLHLSGYAFLNEGSRDAALHALQVARAAGSSVSLDAASAGPIRAVGARRFLDWVSGVDTLLANADEAQALTGLADPEAAARALTASFPAVVVKLGAQGAVWAARGHEAVVRVAALPVEVVDSTGAGDAFAAGWLPVRLAAGDPAAALAAGCALAARAVTRVGARPA